MDGDCYEKCGDGMNYNLQCDDGNTRDGDGCSSECLVEPNYRCRGKNQASQDRCYYVQTELMSGNSTWTNSIIVAFNRPVQTLRSQVDEEDFSVKVISRDGKGREIKWEAMIFEQPF
jgi:cysteine-rich repeat protein